MSTATQDTRFTPVPATVSGRARRASGINALSALTIYVVLLCFVPSNLAIGALGSLGRPALIWGLILAVWWIVHHLQTLPHAVPSPWQPVRLAYGALVVIALISFAYALLRGQPADQVSPAITALVRLVSWGGVLFVAMDGIRTMGDLRTLIRRFVFVAAAVALLGLVQSALGMSLIDQISIPGFVQTEEGGIQARGSFVRAAGTATHPLEFAMLLTMALPLALTSATVEAERRGRHTVGLWICVALISAALLLSASRSALLGFAIAFVLCLPGLSRSLRTLLVTGAGLLVVAIVALRPGMLGTMVSMFTGVSSDPSATSRTSGLAKAPGFIEVSPVVGSGLGTFLPRYYIFDNQWVLIAVELGIAGVLTFAGLIVAACFSALSARRLSSQSDVLTLGQGLFAASATCAALLAGFDGFAFAISAGAFFLVIGLCAALRTISSADRWMHAFRPDMVGEDAYPASSKTSPTLAVGAPHRERPPATARSVRDAGADQ